MDAEVWGFEFEEAMHFFPIDVSDLGPNRGLQTRYCCGMMVDFDHSFLIPVNFLISLETFELWEAVGSSVASSWQVLLSFMIVGLSALLS